MTLGEIADRFALEVHGDPGCLINGTATLQDAVPGTISFFANRKYLANLKNTKASAVILHPDDLSHCPVSALVSHNVSVAWARVAALLAPDFEFEPGIHSSVVIGDGSEIHESVCIRENVSIGARVRVGRNCFVGPGTVIEDGVSIGDDTRLIANVVLCHDITLGSRVLVHPGAIIGSDGFGLANDEGRWIRVPQTGSVQIGDDVDIGANTTIDRGAIADTIIEEGVKLDNQIQVGHNVRIGAHTAIAGCVGIAGSAIIGKHCGIGGAAGIIGHLEITDGVQVTAMSLVTKSITEPGVYSSGTTVLPNNEWNRSYARFRKIDELAKRILALEKRLGDQEQQDS